MLDDVFLNSACSSHSCKAHGMAFWGTRVEKQAGCNIVLPGFDDVFYFPFHDTEP